MVETPEVDPSSTLSRTSSQFAIGFPSPSPSTLSSTLNEDQENEFFSLWFDFKRIILILL